jgi:hypothetical protein
LACTRRMRHGLIVSLCWCDVLPHSCRRYQQNKSLKCQQHKPEDYYKFNSKLFNKYRGKIPKTLFFSSSKDKAD